MKKMTLVLLALLCSMQIMAQERVEVIRKKLFSCDESGVIVAAHRGDIRKIHWLLSTMLSRWVLTSWNLMCNVPRMEYSS